MNCSIDCGFGCPCVPTADEYSPAARDLVCGTCGDEMTRDEIKAGVCVCGGKPIEPMCATAGCPNRADVDGWRKGMCDDCGYAATMGVYTNQNAEGSHGR